MAIPWRQVHLMALAEATRAHRDLEIDTTRRIDPFAALESSGVLVMRRPLDHLAGIYVPADLTDNGIPGVLVNVMHPASKQRFTAAHELGHHRRDRHLVLDRDTEWMARGESRDSDEERLAEAFAAWFLMPRGLVTRTLDALTLAPPRLDPQGAYALSLALGTSFNATVRHLFDMRLIGSTPRNALLRVTPQSIKASLGGLPAVADGRRNVWRINPPAVQSELLPIEGDAVVVEVPETPSSGYVWAPLSVPVGMSFIGDEYHAPDEAALGGTGYHRFLFRVDRPGRRQVTLAMRRPWVPGEAAETVRVAVSAEAAPAAGLVQHGLLVA